MSDTRLTRPSSEPRSQPAGATNAVRGVLHPDGRPPPQALGNAPSRTAPAIVRDEQQGQDPAQSHSHTPNGPWVHEGGRHDYSIVSQSDASHLSDGEVQRLTNQLAIQLADLGKALRPSEDTPEEVCRKSCTSIGEEQCGWSTKWKRVVDLFQEAIATLARQRDRTGQALLRLVASTTSPTIPNYEDRLRQHAAMQEIGQVRHASEGISTQSSDRSQEIPEDILSAWTGRAGSAMREEIAAWVRSQLPQLCAEQLSLAFEAGRNSEHDLSSCYLGTPPTTEPCPCTASASAGEEDTNRIFHNSARWAGGDEELRYTISSVATDPISAGYFDTHSKWYKKQYNKLEVRVQALEAAFTINPPEKTSSKRVRDQFTADAASLGTRGNHGDLPADSSAGSLREQTVTEVSRQLAPSVNARLTTSEVLEAHGELAKRNNALEDSVRKVEVDTRQRLNSSEDHHQQELHQIEHNLQSWLDREHSSLRAECISRQDAVLYDKRLEHMIEAALVSSSVVDCVEQLQDSFRGLNDSHDRLQQDQIKLSASQLEDTRANDVILQGQATKIAKHERLLDKMSKTTNETAIAINGIHVQLNKLRNDGIIGIERMRSVMNEHERQLVELANIVSDYQPLAARLEVINHDVGKTASTLEGVDRLEAIVSEQRASFTLRLEEVQERLELQNEATKLLRDKQDATAHEIKAILHPSLTQILTLVKTI
ncbi:BQ2448_6209 [Microbotryum intermedium]|uniref:BQ2448_6209 protein n=1 Tax=Microbotryum intermedium TaxID=269621 RepID=A0A238FLX7_9BASI|nr:BQ2448_6209 [Microbotryum intermedium]